MALEPGSGRRSVSPESSGRDSPIPRQWRNQHGGMHLRLGFRSDPLIADACRIEDIPVKDKSYRKYAHGVDRALVLFETALEEWADYISFLNRLLKVRMPAMPSKLKSRALIT